MIGGKEVGPLTRVDLGVEAATGKISAQTAVWKEGMEDWCAASEIPDLASLFQRKKEFVPGGGAAPGKKPPPPPPAQKDKGMGQSDFDTSHFRLADLKNEEGGPGGRQMEFDTAHFKLADLKPEDTGVNRDLEFNT